MTENITTQGPIVDAEIRGHSPSDGRPLQPVPTTPVASLPDIVQRCRQAGQRLAARDVHERAALLRQFKDAILRRGEALASELVAETGKPLAEAWLHEVLHAADLGGYWAEEGPAHLAPVEPPLDVLNYPGKRAVVERVPRGVVALITPWNFPVAIPMRTLFPALLAGNGVVLKPSEYSPRSSGLLEDAAREVFGASVVCVVHGGGQVGDALIRAGVDAVVFTGSVATGRKVAHAAADELIPASLELGGKDAAIVLDDANLERTARGLVWGGFVNAGQSCASVERVYATRGIASRLRQRVAELVRELVPQRDIGPLINESQLGIVSAQVEDAKKKGVEIVEGGARLERAGLWFAPTMLGNTPSDAAAMQEETFGPTMPIVEVDSEQAAIAAANASPYGLTASVWSKDVVRAESIARQLRVGVITVNNHGFTAAIPSLPWTGTGASGYGVTNSPHALDHLTRPRALLIDTSRAKSELWWYPYTKGLVQVAQSMAIVKGGGGAWARIRALFGLVAGFARRNKIEP